MPLLYSPGLLLQREFIHKFLEVYMDDWTVYSLLKEHIGLLRLMFDRCR